MQPKDIQVSLEPLKIPPTRDLILPKAVDFFIPVVSIPPEKNALDGLVAELNKPDNKQGDTLFSYSPKEIAPWQNGNPVYNPYVDMEDTYAKADPFTFGDVLSKTWSTAKNHIGSSYTILGSGLKELSKGNWSGFWDNSSSQHLADLTKELEELKPLYRTKDARDNPLSWRNWDTTAGVFLPALGTVTAVMVDVAIGHVIASGVGALGGPAGVVGANIGAFAKDSVALRSAFQSLYAVSKALQVTGGARKISSLTAGLVRSTQTIKMSTKAKSIAAGLFYANGEAALQAELNSQNHLDQRQAKYYAEHGNYMGGDQLKNLQEEAKQVGALTYGLNLPLVAAAQFSMFGNMILGKSAPNLLNKLPVAFRKVKGVITPLRKNSLVFGVKELLGDMASEGFEEFGQSVIDKSVSTYYDPLKTPERSVGQLGRQLLTDAYEHAQTQEGVLDFLGGAFIGGLVTGGKAIHSTATGNTYGKRADRLITQFNSTTDLLIQNTLRSDHTGSAMQEAFLNEDIDKINELVESESFHVAQAGVFNGTIDARIDQLTSLKDIGIDDFNSMFDTDLRKEDRDNYIDSVVSSVNKAKDIVAQVNEVHAVNPYVGEGWFDGAINFVKNRNNPDRTTAEIANRVWHDFKSITAFNLYKYDNMDTQLKEVKESLGRDSFLINTDIGKAVRDFKKLAKNRQVLDDVKTDSPRSKSYNKILVEIEGLEIHEQYDKIIKFLDFAEVDENLVKTGLRYDAAKKLALNSLGNWNTKSGQKQAIVDIAEYLEYIYAEPTVPNQDKVIEKEIEVNQELDNDKLNENVTTSKVNDTVTEPKQEDGGKEGKETSEEEGKTKKEEFKKLTQEKFNNESISHQLDIHTEGYFIQNKDEYMVVTSDNGFKVKGLRITQNKDGYFIIGVPIDSTTFSGGQKYKITKAVSNKNIEVRKKSELTAPQRNETGARQTKQERLNNIDKYQKEMQSKFGRDSKEYAKEIKLLADLDGFIEIICE